MSDKQGQGERLAVINVDRLIGLIRGVYVKCGHASHANPDTAWENELVDRVLGGEGDWRVVPKGCTTLTQEQMRLFVDGIARRVSEINVCDTFPVLLGPEVDELIAQARGKG